MAVPERVKTQMKKHGLSGVNKPKKTPQHPKKSHIVMASWSEGGGTKYRLIRFGEQGAKTAGKPKAGEGRKMTMKSWSGMSPRVFELWQQEGYTSAKTEATLAVLLKN